MTAIAFDAVLEDSQMMAAINRIERRMMGMTDTVEREGKNMDNAFKNVAAGMAAYFSADMMAGLVGEIVNVRGEFQKYEAVLSNSFGSTDKAKESMAMLADVASTTPFQLDAITDSYVKLVNQGFTPTRAEIIKMGDLASSTGKGFDQLTEAILDAQAGEFERLKEFGVKASVSGDQVTMTFKGQKTTIDNTAESMRAYLLSLGDMQGVSGSMAAISKTLVGQVSNLKDAWDAMLNSMGQDTEGILSGAIGVAGDLVQNYETVLGVLGTLVATYGTYKAAVIAIATLEKITSASKAATLYLEMNSALGALTIGHKANAVAIGIETAAQAALNAVMSVNPYVLAVTAIAAVTAAVWALHDETTVAQKAQEEYNKAKEQAAADEEAHKQKIEELISTATNQALADMERVKSLGELKKEYPKIFSQYDIENLKLADILKLKKQIAAEDGRKKTETNANNAKSQAEKVAELQKQYDKAQSVAQSSGSYVSVSAKLIKDQLDKEKAKLKLYDKEVQTDRANSWIANVKNLTNKQIESELAARKHLINSIEQKGGNGKGYIKGTLNGAFNKDELSAQTNALENEYNRRNEKTYNYVELQKKYQKELSDLEAKKESLKSQKLTESDKNKQMSDIESKIKEAKAKLDSYSPKTKTPKTKEKTELELYKESLDKKKKEYEDYENWVTAFGQESADKRYAALLESGKTYEEYLKSQRTSIAGADGSNKLTTTQVGKVNLINGALDEKTGFEKFKEQLDAIKSSSKDVYEQLEKLNKLDMSKLSAGDKVKASALQTTAVTELQDGIQKDLLDKYATTEDQKKRIIEQSSKEIAFMEKMQWTDRANVAREERDKMLAELDMSKFDKDNKGLLDQVFGDLEGQSTDDILQLIEKVRNQMDALDETTKNSEGFGQLAQNLTKLEGQVKDNEKNPFSKLKRAWEDYQNALGTDNAGAAFAKLASSASGALDITKEMFDSVVGGMKELGIAGDEQTQELLGNISGAIGGASQLAMGIATGNPLSIVQGTVGLITNGIKIFDGKSRQIERDIKKHQQAVKDLEYAYNDLKRAVDDALGTGAYDAQKNAISNLQQQKKEYEELLRLEQSKKGKDKDQGKIDEYRKQLQQLGYDIADEQKQLTEELIQTNVKDFAQSLADSLTDAFSQGESAAKAFDKTVNDVMLNVVKNAFKKNVIETALTPLVNQMTGAMADYNISPEEMAAIQSVAGQVKGNVLAGMEQYKSMISSLGLSDSSNSLEGAMKGITSEQASLLAGQFNALRVNSAEGLRLNRDMLEVLQQIASNTSPISEIRDMVKSAIFNNDLRSKGL